MSINADEWSYSIVTYHGGYSHTVAGVRFSKGMPKKVKSLALRNRLRGESGFHFKDFSKPSAVPASKQAAAPPAPSKKKKIKKIKKIKKPEVNVVEVSNGGDTNE